MDCPDNCCFYAQVCPNFLHIESYEDRLNIKRSAAVRDIAEMLKETNNKNINIFINSLKYLIEFKKDLEKSEIPFIEPEVIINVNVSEPKEILKEVEEKESIIDLPDWLSKKELDYCLTLEPHTREEYIIGLINQKTKESQKNLNTEHPEGIKEIINELQISKDEYIEEIDKEQLESFKESGGETVYSEEKSKETARSLLGKIEDFAVNVVDKTVELVDDVTDELADETVKETQKILDLKNLFPEEKTFFDTLDEDKKESEEENTEE